MAKPVPSLLLALVAVPALAACQRSTPPAQAPAANPAQPRLWSVEVLDGGKVVSRVDICADQAIRASFTRPAPEVGGQPCVRTKEPVARDGVWFTRCTLDGQTYRVSSQTHGNPAADFTVDMAVTRHDRSGPVYEQVRRYRLLGDCPPGWHIGDSAAPGDKQILDTISGKARPRPAAGG